MQANASGWRGFIWTGLLFSLVNTSGCGNEAPNDEFSLAEQSHVFEQKQLDAWVEAGLDDTLPVVTTEEFELYHLAQHRRQVAETMRASVQSAMAPAVLAASLFAVEGMADLILAITPVHKTDRVLDIFRQARRAKANQKHAGDFEELASEVSKITGHGLDDLVRFGSVLGKEHLNALRTIRRETGSAKTTHTLLAQQIKGHADILWIAKLLDRRYVDHDFIRRFTFDGDIVREYTEYSANPSWKTLHDVASGITPVAKKTRDSLASKVTGLLGEQAAVAIVRSPTFRRRYMGSDHGPLTLARGVGYGGNRSIDIVASGQHTAVFVEVKNWSVVSWMKKSMRNRVMAQLERHNQGVSTMLAGKTPANQHRFLMVRKYDYEMWKRDARVRFERELQQLGWIVEPMPVRHIPNFSDLLDSVK